MKHIYKLTGLFLLFLVCLYIFGRSIPEIAGVSTKTTNIQDSTFPITYFQLGDKTLNTLHGYSSELDSSSVRESITPLDNSKSFTVKIQQNNSKIKKLDYALKDIANDKILEENTLSAFDTRNTFKLAKITLNAALDTSKEYGFQITLTTNYSKKIHFYTRIKYYNTDFFLQEKISFVDKFHKATFDNGKSFDISKYLEANTNDNSTFADVDIHSGLDMVCWKKLNPKKVTEVTPVIKEINIETASVFQEYYVQAKTDYDTEFYHVKEFYRVRYSGNKIYLLAFHRKMESIFDTDFISTKTNEIKIGITNENELDITPSDSNKKFAFVRNRTLWYYDLSSNVLTNVFSFDKFSKSDLKNTYDQHNINILTVDDSGNISFVLYGYMNCGDYEGRVGILLYDYNAKKNELTERVYIPLTTTYQKLKEEFGKFCYVNGKNIFYFSLNNVVYAYNIASKRYDILTRNATRDHFTMLETAKCFVWSSLDENGYNNSISILDLDTSKTLTVNSKQDESIIVLGTIDANIVYGFVRNRDIYEKSTGDIVKPAYKLLISDCKGNILRSYHSKNRYVIDAVVDENVIHLQRCKRVNGKFVDTAGDTIMNQKDSSTQSIRLTDRVTQKTLTESYISLPAGFQLAKKPKIATTRQIMITENPTLHLKEEELQTTAKYYLYARGEITGSYTNISKAIQEADLQMGTIMDNTNHLVWERGGKFLSKELSNINYPSDTSSSKKACAYMLLQAAQVTTTTSELKGTSIFSMLKKHLERPVNLSGCTLDEILYFVSNERPVIGMTDNNHAVLIIGYTSSTVTWMDPSTRQKRTMSLTSAEQLFKNAGYQFISYIQN